MNSTVSGTGTGAKVFAQTLNIPGTGRVDGRTVKVRASGYCYQNGTSGKVLLSMLSHDPKYAPTAISASSVTTNVATFVAPNNFVAGQKVTIIGCTNGAVVDPPSPSPLNVAAATVASAQSDRFTVAITTDDLVAAAEASVAVASIDPVLMFSSTSRSVTKGSYAPWQIEMEFVADSHSGTLEAMTSAAINNLVNGEAAVTTPPTGLNLQQEPVLTLSVSATFDASDADNKAVMREFRIVE